MTRPLRVEFPGATYHVMNRGLGGLRPFLEEADHQRFVGLLSDVAQRWDVKTHAYCLMSNHYHVLLQTPRGNLSRVMRHVDGLYTQRFNRGRGRDGPLFRGRFKALVVDRDEYLLQLVRYIHLNPVKAGLVKDPGRYPMSSHRLYRMSKRPDWLGWEEVMGHFKDGRAFERYVAEGNEKSLEAFYALRRWSPFLGGATFLDRVRQHVRRSREHPRREGSPQYPTLEAVGRAVCERCGVDEGQLSRSRRGQWNEARNLAIFVSSRVAGFAHPEIRRHYGLGTNEAVTRVSQRVEARAKEDGRLRARIENLGKARG